MEFCNKGMVWADPLPPSYGQRPYFYIFYFWDPSLIHVMKNSGQSDVWIKSYSPKTAICGHFLKQP